MSVALYMDEHIRQPVTNGLRQRRIDILTVQEDGRRGEDDDVLLDRATKLGRVIFTQDQDFLIEGARRQREGVQFAGVIFADQGRITVGQCVRDLELIASVCSPDELADKVIYLPLH